VAARVAAARTIQAQRYAELNMPRFAPTPRRPRNLEEVESPTMPSQTAARRGRDDAAVARGYHRFLRVARRLRSRRGGSGRSACISPKRCPIAPLARRVAGSVASYAANIMSSQFPYLDRM